MNNLFYTKVQAFDRNVLNFSPGSKTQLCKNNLIKNLSQQLFDLKHLFDRIFNSASVNNFKAVSVQNSV